MSILGPRLSVDFLYTLLPEFIRNRDFYQGQPLRALMSVLENEYRTLWDDVGALYDDWFIETCAPERIAAIGDLVALTDGGNAPANAADLRALTANAIAYRRRKGVPAVLERVLYDATGWAVRVAEPGKMLVSCPALDAPRPTGGTVDLRNQAALAAAGTAFDELPRLAAVRRPPPGTAYAPSSFSGGSGVLPTDLAISIWRLEAFPVERTVARRIVPGGYTFHPLGVDTPLFNQPRTPTQLTAPITPLNLPTPLYPDPLARWLASPAAAELPFAILDPATGHPVSARGIVVADLSTWQRPAATDANGARVAVDPLRGRLAFVPGLGDDGPIMVSYCFGGPADIGGGPYPRVAPSGKDELWQAEVIAAESGAAALAARAQGAAVSFPSLAAALEAWARNGRRRGSIRLKDHRNQATGARALGIQLEGGRELEIAADDPGPGILAQDLVALASDDRPGRLRLAGLWLGGRLETRGRINLEISHCTLAPPGRAGEPTQPSPALMFSGDGPREITLESSVVGPVYHRAGLTRLRIWDTVIDGGPVAKAISAAGTPAKLPGSGRLELELERVTALGAVHATSISRAESVLFAGPLQVLETTVGTLAYCYVPAGSSTPTRVRCQPDLALALDASAGGTDTETTLARVVPHFASRRYGSPVYAQLSSRCSREILTGAADGGQIGAFERLRQPQREAAMRETLADYLPFGLEARIDDAT